MSTSRQIKRKTAGAVSSLFYYEQQDGSRIELEASGYFTPEQHGSETDPYIAPNISLERITNEQGKPVAISPAMEEEAMNALWKEIR